jgi:hypothetical protein
MLAQLKAKDTAVHAAASGFDRRHFRTPAWLVLATISLGGCLQTAPPPMIGADPADPSARVAGTGYRSTTAPYTRMRPTAPTAWGGRNSDAPSSKTDE